MFVGRIGKRVSFPCGTAAVKAKFEKNTTVKTGRDFKTQTLEPEDLPFNAVAKGNPRPADGPNVRAFLYLVSGNNCLSHF